MAFLIAWTRGCRRLAILLTIALQLQGYSILTHEAIIDATWVDHIVPALKARYPDATDVELKEAHAYAYGGAIIQDIGYYPFGNRFVSDLTHYVRSGDFIQELLGEAKDVNEYAFALGALAHYAADNNGHRMAVNKAVPLMYPKLRTRVGDIVTYADDRISHVKVEFAFDVAQIAQGHYDPASYHQFIGFEVSEKALERAFRDTYALELSSLFDKDLAIGTYRYAASTIIPALTKAAWSAKGKDILKTQPSATKNQFIYNLSRSEFQREWGPKYRGPSFAARLLGVIFRILPKVGPLRAFAFRPPSPEAEHLFMASVNQTVAEYRKLLTEQSRGVLKLANGNFDTGGPIEPGRYRFVDEAFAKLVLHLAGKPIAPELRNHILAFYADRNSPLETKRDRSEWMRLLTTLDALEADANREPQKAPTIPRSTR